MDLRIRPAAKSDLQTLYALDQACFPRGIAWSRAELQYFLLHPGNLALAAEESGRIAGFAIAAKELRQGKTVGRLITIDVDPQLRRQGVGRVLLQQLEEQLQALGASAMALEVAVDNDAAQAFYARHGFARTGRIPGYYLGRIDALTMEKPLQR